MREYRGKESLFYYSVLLTVYYNTVNREYFMSKIFRVINFHVKYFLDRQPRTALPLIMHIYFRAFNFRISQAIRKYFNNKIFTIYGSLTCTLRDLWPSVRASIVTRINITANTAGT